MSRKIPIFILAVVIGVSVAVAAYFFSGGNRFEGGLMDKLLVDDMTRSKAYGWVFLRLENYNGELVLYIEGLHRIVFATPVREDTKLTGRPDISVRMRKELKIYGNILTYEGRQYTIAEFGSYTLPSWESEALLSGGVKAFTSSGHELEGVEYTAFPILDAIALYRTSPITLSPYANYFISITECRVYDNTAEYLVSGGSRVVFHVDTMEYDHSTDPEIDRAFKEGELDHSEESESI